MPQLGESIAEATIVNFWSSPATRRRRPGCHRSGNQQGDHERGRAVRRQSCQHHGQAERKLSRRRGLGHIELTPEEAQRAGFGSKSGPADPAPSPPMAAKAGVEAKPAVQPTVRGLPVPAHAAGASYMSPRMKARMNELGLHAADLAGLAGSGAAGRVTIQDFEKFLANLETNKLTNASSMRVAVADAMRRSWTRPLATVALPCPLEAMLAHRKVSQPKIGPALYALRALALALAENSAPPGGWSATKSFIRLPLTSVSPSKPRTACWCPCCATPMCVRWPRTGGPLQRTGRIGAPTPSAAGRHRRLHRHGDQFRNFRFDMGHAHSAAGTNPGAGPGRGQKVPSGTKRRTNSCP
jgi:hypothetical protein